MHVCRSRREWRKNRSPGWLGLKPPLWRKSLLSVECSKWHERTGRPYYGGQSELEFIVKAYRESHWLCVDSPARPQHCRYNV